MIPDLVLQKNCFPDMVVLSVLLLTCKCLQGVVVLSLEPSCSVQQTGHKVYGKKRLQHQACETCKLNHLGGRIYTDTRSYKVRQKLIPGCIWSSLAS
jgi:hypothetical protein